MKKFRQITCLLLSVLLITALFTAVPFTANAAENTDETVGDQSGTSGDCTWGYTSSDRTLTVSGSGAMADYTIEEDYEYDVWKNGTMPWWSFCNDIKSVVIGNGVTYIGNSAFFKCKNLTSLTIGSGVTKIGNYAFSNCGLTEVTIPANVTEIGRYAFGWDLGAGYAEDEPVIGFTIYGKAGSSAEEYATYDDNYFDFIPVGTVSGTTGDCAWELDNGVLTISGTGAMDDYGYEDDTPWYSYSDTITSIVIGDGVTHIGNNAFAYLDPDSITFGSGIKTIGDYAFNKCGGITSFTLKASYTSVGIAAFMECDIADLTIEEGVTTFGKAAFEDNPLTSVKLPDSMTVVPEDAFNNCHSLTNVTFGSNVTAIGDHAFGGCGLKALDLPDTVTTIGTGAYSGCKFTELTIPDSVTTIKTEAFFNIPELHSVSIPETVTTIGSHAFGWRSYLNSSGSVVTEKVDPFTIYGKPGSKAEEYANTYGFTFKNYVKKYDLWLGGTQVTEENMDDICGDGMAFYYPDSNALYLFDPNIQGTYSKGEYTYKIYSGIKDLEINGSCTMETAQADIALSVADGTSIFGNHIFTGTEYGIYSNGDLNIYMGNVTGKGGTYGIKADGNITIGDSITRVEANGGIRGSSLTLGSSVSVTWPEDGVVENGTVTVGGIPVNYANFEASNTVIDSVSLNVPEPEAGEMPSVDVFGDTGYMVESVSWRDADNDEYVYSAFQPGHQYYVEVNLRADFRYEFAQDVNATINGKTASVKALNDNDLSEGICVYFYFPRLSGDIPDTEITQVSLDNVEIPKAGEAWDYSAWLDTEGCELTSVKLFLSGEEIAPGTILDKKKYIAEFAVTAKDGYKFTYDLSGMSNLTGMINESSWATSKDYEPGVCDEKHAVVQWVLSVTEEVEYHLWVGNTQANYSNKDDILNDGGKAKFDPVTNTLTLNDPVIDGYSYIRYSKTCTIYSYGINNLTIKGSYAMTSASADYVVYNATGSITLDGDFVFKGVENGIYTLYNLTVSGGTVTVESNKDYAVKCSGIFTVTDDVTKFKAQTNGEYGCAIHDYAEGVTLGSQQKITVPKNGFVGGNGEYGVSEDCYTILDEYGNTPQKVVIEKTDSNEEELYKLWLGSTWVTSDNKDDILNDGGKAKFDPATNTLTLNDPVIPGAFYDIYNDSCKIYSAYKDLTIKGSYKMTNASEKYSVYSKNLTLNGDFVFKSYYGFTVYNLIINGGTVDIESTLREALRCFDSLTITNDVTKVSAKTVENGYGGAVYRYIAEINLGSQLKITTPEGGYVGKIGEDRYTIFDKDGNDEPLEVVIEKTAAPARKIGDVNNDGSIDVLDANMIQKYVVEKVTLTDEQKYVADVNDDGIVDVLDANLIQKYVVEKIREFKKKA